MFLDPFNAFFSAQLALGEIIFKSLYKQDGSKCDHMELTKCTSRQTKLPAF
jgi:hypothetical protein